MNTDYLKFVRWSDEDKVYVGNGPDLFSGGVCHGKNATRVYSKLCAMVEDDIVHSQSPTVLDRRYN